MRRLLSALRIIFYGYLLLSFLGVVFVTPFVHYYRKSEPQSHYSFLYLAIALIIGAVGVAIAYAWTTRRQRRRAIAAAQPPSALRFGLELGAGFAALIAVQVFIIHGALFVAGWDVGMLMLYAENGLDEFIADYLSAYGNQVFFFSLTKGIYWLFGGGNAGFMALVVGSCVCVDVSLGLCALIARKVTKSNGWGIVAFVLGGALIGISPWIMVPYTDTYGMLCPTLALFLVVYLPESPVKSALVLFVAVMGYFIKPTAIFIAVALIVVEFTRWMENCGKRAQPRAARSRRWRKRLISCLSGILGIVVALGVATAVSTPLAQQLDGQRNFGVAHYLYMGANPETQGLYSEDDVTFSRSFETADERNAADFSVWWERVSSMGVPGLAKLAAAKTLTNFDNGTFFWLSEGVFFQQVLGDDEALLDYFGLSGKGLSPLFFSIAQVIWFIVIIGALLSFLRKPRPIDFIVELSLLMLFVFLLIFECRSRYLILYLPYMVLLATIGYQAVTERLLRAAASRRAFPAGPRRVS